MDMQLKDMQNPQMNTEVDNSLLVHESSLPTGYLFHFHVGESGLSFMLAS